MRTVIARRRESPKASTAHAAPAYAGQTYAVPDSRCTDSRDLLPRQVRISQCGVFGNEKIPRNEPGSDRPPAVRGKEHDRGDREHRELERRAKNGTHRRSTPQEHECGQDDGRRCDEPRFVSRHARGRQRQAGSPRPSLGATLDPGGDERERDETRCQEQGLGHRRALDIEQIRIGEQERRAGGTAGHGTSRGQDESRQGPGRNAGARDRNGNRGRARSIPCVDLHRHHVQEVRQGKPDGADLLPPRRQAVEDAACHDEVRPRIEMADREIAGRVEPGAGRASEERGNPDEQWRKSVLQLAAPPVVRRRHSQTSNNAVRLTRTYRRRNANRNCAEKTLSGPSG